jgi:hypothetical protein
MSNVPFALNQQFQQGCSMAQQAMQAEQSGNLRDPSAGGWDPNAGGSGQTNWAC